MFGGAIGYWQGSQASLVDDIIALKPTMFIGVPRLFTAMHEMTMAGVNSSNVFAKILFDMAYSRKKSRIDRGVPSAKVGYEIISKNHSSPFLARIHLLSSTALVGQLFLILIFVRALLQESYQYRHFVHKVKVYEIV